MDEIIKTVITPGVLVLGVTVYILTSGIKRFIEMVVPNLKKIGGELGWGPMFQSQVAMWWNTGVIHVLPVALGLIAGLIKSDFLFHGINDWGGRVLFGGGVGWFSGTIFKGVDKAVTSKLGVSPAEILNGSPAGTVTVQSTPP